MAKFQFLVVTRKLLDEYEISITIKEAKEKLYLKSVHVNIITQAKSLTKLNFMI